MPSDNIHHISIREVLKRLLTNSTNGQDALNIQSETTNAGGNLKHDDLSGSALAKAVVASATTYPVDMREYGRANITVIPLAAITYGVTIAWSSDGDINNATAAVTLLATGTGGNRGTSITPAGNFAHITLTPAASESFWMSIDGRELT